MIDYNASYLGRILNAVSQLGNALSGGNPDISISARLGSKTEEQNRFWRTMLWIVNTTFYPIDGPDHCFDAYLADADEDYKIEKGGVFGLALMSILLSLVCLILGPILWTFHGFKKLIKIFKK